MRRTESGRRWENDFETRPCRLSIARLEDLLHHFHVTCAPAVEGMPPGQRLFFLAKTSCVAADAFMTCTDHRRKLDLALLTATHKYQQEVEQFLAIQNKGGTCPRPVANWIDFAAVAAAEQAAAKAKANALPAAMQLPPKVKSYDEANGLPETAPDSRAAAEHHPP